MIASATRSQQRAFLESLTRNEIRALPYIFEFWAMDHQLPPEGDWKTWVILGGRGAGKTRAGAEWVRSRVEGSKPDDPGRCRRLALIGETYDQVRDVMVLGESGIVACSPPDRKPVWEAGRRRLVWSNGAEAKVFSANDPEALRGPQFDGAWVDEIGCAAIDKGTNQPNKFLDPKSSESALPKYSSGARDDLIQLQYLKALRSYWSDAENNPVSSVFDGQMVDASRMFVWAWDARPYPQFPLNAGVWSDGDNYATGHWLTGRASSRSLSSVVQDICADAGVEDVDTRNLNGIVRGYSLRGDEDARAALQPLALAHGFDAMEAGGQLSFASRSNRPVAQVSHAEMAREGVGPVTSHVRTPEAEMAGRVRLFFLDAESDYQLRAVESISPDERSTSIEGSELPVAMTESEAQTTVERWLSEARVSRDAVSFALPPSSRLAVGDVIELAEPKAGGRYRIDRIEDGGLKRVEAVRVDPATIRAAPVDLPSAPVTSPVVPLPVWAAMLDLPLLRGDETAVGPWVAATAEPWAGPVAVYSSLDSSNWRFVEELDRPAMLGRTLNDLTAATPGIWDRGEALHVRFPRGSLSSIDSPALLAGGNVAAIGEPGGDWEIFQFRDAVLSEDGSWALSMRLRGQRGTDAEIRQIRPAGSTVLVLDQALRQIAVPEELAGLPLHYRIGPAIKPVDHPSYIEFAHVADPLALRPYRPAHLRAAPQSGGAVHVSWVRRTRVGGDAWALADVPVGEAFESYTLRVLKDGVVRREITTTTSDWTYTAAMQAADSLTGAFDIEVAQISDLYGPGAYARITINV